MKKDPKIFLEHIIQSIEDIEEYTRNISREQFLEDGKLQDAVIRKLEIIGEAIKNLPRDFRKKHSEIRWKSFAGMRDILIHHYFGVDLEIIWTATQRDIPQLKNAILELLEHL